MPDKSGHRNLLALNGQLEIEWIADLPQREQLYSYYDDIELNQDMDILNIPEHVDPSKAVRIAHRNAA